MSRLQSSEPNSVSWNAWSIVWFARSRGPHWHGLAFRRMGINCRRGSEGVPAVSRSRQAGCIGSGVSGHVELAEARPGRRQKQQSGWDMKGGPWAFVAHNIGYSDGTGRTINSPPAVQGAAERRDDGPRGENKLYPYVPVWCKQGASREQSGRRIWQHLARPCSAEGVLQR